MEYKYKVGDKVRVRSDLIENDYYYMEHGETKNYVVSPMMIFRGLLVTIANIDLVCQQYEIEEDNSHCFWTDEMFEGLAEETKFHIYDTVKDEKFGLGTVIGVKENKIKVDFDEIPFTDDIVAVSNIVVFDLSVEEARNRLTLIEAYTGGEDY